MTDVPLTAYCPGCGAYVFLLGAGDYQCGLCGCVFVVLPAEPVASEVVEDGLPF